MHLNALTSEHVRNCRWIQTLNPWNKGSPRHFVLFFQTYFNRACPLESDRYPAMTTNDSKLGTADSKQMAKIKTTNISHALVIVMEICIYSISGAGQFIVHYYSQLFFSRNIGVKYINITMSYAWCSKSCITLCVQLTVDTNVMISHSEHMGPILKNG